MEENEELPEPAPIQTLGTAYVPPHAEQVKYFATGALALYAIAAAILLWYFWRADTDEQALSNMKADFGSGLKNLAKAFPDKKKRRYWE